MLEKLMFWKKKDVVSSVDRTGAPYIMEGLQTAANTQRAKCPQLAMELEL